MKKIESVNLCNGLSEITGYTGVKFNYAIAKNISKLESEVKILSKQEARINDLLKEYNKERIELCEEHSKKDDNGQSLKIIRKNIEQYVMNDPKSFSKALEELKTKHSESLDKYENEHKDFQQLLENTESEVELHKIKIEDIPENIKTEDMRHVLLIIE